MPLANLISFGVVDTTAIPADNITARTLKLQIDKNTPEEKRQVILTTDLGSFTNQQTTITLLADANGNASSQIKSDAPGTANVTASCNGFSTSIALTFATPNPDNIVKFDNNLLTNTTADGVSTLALRAVINNATPAALRKVTFASDQGTLANGQTTQDVIPDANGIAATTLRSGTEGTANVSITHRNVTRTMAFNFTRAYPDTIMLLSNFTLQAGLANSTTITTQLNRNIGKPGMNFEIDYTAADNLGNSIGQFKNATLSNASGMATVLFSAGNTAYRGPVLITATVKEIPTKQTTALITIVN